MAKYRTRDSDVLDQICYRFYGRHTGTVEAVLAANPGLVEAGLVLKAGIMIELPDIPESTSPLPLRLWD